VNASLSSDNFLCVCMRILAERFSYDMKK